MSTVTLVSGPGVRAVHLYDLIGDSPIVTGSQPRVDVGLPVTVQVSVKEDWYQPLA